MICPHCGSTLQEGSQFCHICGAQLAGVMPPPPPMAAVPPPASVAAVPPVPPANTMSAANQTPRSIAELQACYTAHHLPPEEVTRFFIGKNTYQARAFGVYRNEVGEFVVYKNKANGQRAIRYQGMDEAHAVEEIYLKLRDEMAQQKAHNRTQRANSRQRGTSYASTPYSNGLNRATGISMKKNGCLGRLGFIGIIIAVIIGAVVMSDKVPNGYYRYNGTEYYHQGSSWYRYNPLSDNWLEAESMSDFITDDNADQYRYYNHQGTSFESTDWYDDGSSYDDSSDYDDDWDDDDDWDSGSSDWDSDW